MKAFFQDHPICRDTLKNSIMLFLLWALDPFGAATNSDQASEALFYRIFAQSYPKPFDGPEYTGPEVDNTQIAVIVINDESLAYPRVLTGEVEAEVIPPGDAPRKERVTWPPSMLVHKTIIERIFRFATPKAVFIDFGFFDDRDPGATEKFATTLLNHTVPPEKLDEYRACQTKRADKVDLACNDWLGRAPIFLPGADAEAPAHLILLPQLAAAATALVSTKYIGEEFGTYNQYDLFGCIIGSSGYDPVVAAPSAAHAMFSATHNVATSNEKEPVFRTADCKTEKTPPRLSVYWSDWSNAEQGRGSYTCKELRRSWLGRLWLVLKFTVSSAFSWLPWIDVQPLLQFQTCPPHLSVSAHDFLSDKTGEMEEVLDDRYVFYGGNFAMADDLIRPPTHDPIPGVYVHAMVLDNLLNEKGRVAKSIEGKVIFTALTILVAAFISALIWNRGPFYAKLKRIADKHVALALLMMFIVILFGYAVCFFVVLAIASIAFFYFDLAPINFAGIFVFAVLYGLGQVVEWVVKLKPKEAHA